MVGKRIWKLAVAVGCTMLAFPVPSNAAASQNAAAQAKHPAHWVGGWSGPADQPGLLSGAVAFYSGTGGRTVRNLVHLTLGGQRVRVRLTNVFGNRIATFTDVRVALAGAAASLQPGTSRRLRFSGRTTVRVTPGRQVESDPVSLGVRAGQNLAVSIYAPHATGTVTPEGSLNHSNYISGPGDASAATAASAFPNASRAWYWIAGVDVSVRSGDAGAIVALGDSITAGYASTLDASRDWVDLLARRLHRADVRPEQSLLNEGIAGNNLHESSPCYGQSALVRMKRDALSQPGVRYVIVDEGVNDITHPTEPPSAPLYGCLAHRKISAAGLIALYKRAAERIHAAHLRAIGVTLSPFGRYAYWAPAIERERQAINRWIRATHAFDGIIDFDQALRDPSNPAWLNPSYDSGDGLHPNDAGHAAMADFIRLGLFGKVTPSAPSRARKLPSNFLWGVSSSAFQSEGHTTDANWNYYIRRDDGPHPIGSHKQAYGNSVDFYDRYRSDIALAAHLGVNIYRISINWTRVEPRPGHFSQSGLRFYDRVLARMAHFGIQPLITLNHWDYPMWVRRQGGWTSRKTANDFLSLTRVLARRYGHRVKYWLTFNEEFFFEYIEKGNFPLTGAQVLAMRQNLIAAHIGAYKLIHHYSRHAMVSSNYAWPGRGALASVETEPFLNRVKRYLDYVALDYYYPAYDQLSTLLSLSNGTSWEIPLDPFGMYTALRSMHRQFPRRPVLITENGMPTDNGHTRSDGVSRSQNLQDTLYWVQRARQAGVPVIGYMYWSLTDNYEWGSYQARFGLYTVNVRSDPRLVRHPTSAVTTYRRLAARGGVSAGFQPLERPTSSVCATASVAPQDRATCRAAAGV